MRNYLLFAALFIMITISYAEEKELVMNAASLLYDKDGSRVEARGSVEAVYKSSKITGEHLVYYAASREVFLDDGFTLAYNGLCFSGKTLKYSLSRESGVATDVKIIYDRANISGGEVSFDHDALKLKNANFDACGLTPPHYHLSAANIDLYQKQAWLVAYWGVFWLGALPSLPIPVYVYDFKAEQKGKKNIMPYPEAGMNNDDGLFIRETMSWHLRPEMNGSYNISYAGKKGAGGGFTLQYNIDEDRSADANIGLSASEAMSGGLQYIMNFGREVGERRGLIMLPVETYKQFLLDIKFAARERINYERVTRSPEVALAMNRTNFLDGWLEGSSGFGNIAEESSGRSLMRSDLSSLFSFPVFDGLSASADLRATVYGDMTHWLKMLGGLDYSNQVDGNFGYDAGYSHYFVNQGQSPFNYEKYRFNACDKLRGTIYSLSGSGRYILSCVYDLPGLVPQEIDYTAGLKLHCFNIDVTYRAMRQEFALGFSLN